MMTSLLKIGQKLPWHLKNYYKITNGFILPLLSQSHLQSKVNLEIRSFQTNSILYEGFFKNFIKTSSLFQFDKSKLRNSAFLHYENIVDNFDYITFFKRFELPDTFNSWFLATELHIWMISVRLMAEGDKGRFVRNVLISHMWNDIHLRLKKMNITNIKGNTKEMNDQFQASLIGYDEGLLSDDKVLAGVIWRRIFQKQCTKPLLVESLVKYIRQQISLLDEEKSEQILYRPINPWIKFELIK